MNLILIIILMNWEQARLLTKIDEKTYWKHQSMVPGGLITSAYNHYRAPLYETLNKGFYGQLWRYRRGMVTYTLPNGAWDSDEEWEKWMNTDSADLPSYMFTTEQWKETDNLWGQGTVPEEYRDFFEPNSEIKACQTEQGGIPTTESSYTAGAVSMSQQVYRTKGEIKYECTFI